MEFINIATEHIDTELGAIHSELRSFVLNTKLYNSHLSTSIVPQQVFNTGACVLCSIVKIALNNHFINDENHTIIGESKKLKPGSLDKHKVLLKSPCLKEGVMDEMPRENAKERDGDDSLSTHEDADAGKSALTNEACGETFKGENGVHDRGTQDGGNGEVEPVSVTTDQMEIDEKQNKKALRKQEAKNRKKLKQMQKGNTTCTTWSTILKASCCLDKIEYNDIFRRDIMNILSFWFGSVGIPQLTSSVRQVIPRCRWGMSTIYEWTLCSRVNNSFKAVIIPICALSDSRLLIQQSYGLVFNDKEKLLSAYIHKDFDVDVPNFCIVPSVGWIIDTVLPKLKERAELRDKDRAAMSIDNNDVQSSVQDTLAH